MADTKRAQVERLAEIEQRWLGPGTILVDSVTVRQAIGDIAEMHRILSDLTSDKAVEAAGQEITRAFHPHTRPLIDGPRLGRAALAAAMRAIAAPRSETEQDEDADNAVP